MGNLMSYEDKNNDAFQILEEAEKNYQQSLLREKKILEEVDKKLKEKKLMEWLEKQYQENKNKTQAYSE